MSATPPPVPRQLREMLKDYPEYIDRIQSALNRVVEKKTSGVGPFERAIWMLEGALESFYSEARRELKAAEESGDAEEVERARTKKILIGQARMRGIHDLDEVWSYFKRGRNRFL